MFKRQSIVIYIYLFIYTVWKEEYTLNARPKASMSNQRPRLKSCIKALKY